MSAPDPLARFKECAQTAVSFPDLMLCGVPSARTVQYDKVPEAGFDVSIVTGAALEALRNMIKANPKLAAQFETLVGQKADTGAKIEEDGWQSGLIPYYRIDADKEGANLDGAPDKITADELTKANTGGDAKVNEEAVRNETMALHGLLESLKFVADPKPSAEATAAVQAEAKATAAEDRAKAAEADRGKLIAALTEPVPGNPHVRQIRKPANAGVAAREIQRVRVDDANGRKNTKMWKIAALASGAVSVVLAVVSLVLGRKVRKANARATAAEARAASGAGGSAPTGGGAAAGTGGAAPPPPNPLARFEAAGIKIAGGKATFNLQIGGSTVAKAGLDEAAVRGELTRVEAAKGQAGAGAGPMYDGAIARLNEVLEGLRVAAGGSGTP